MIVLLVSDNNIAFTIINVSSKLIYIFYRIL